MSAPQNPSIPVIDLFAGPGGLGEGFSRIRSPRFQIVVSIEKDEMAHDTLRLRAAHRALQRDPEVDATTWAQWDDIVEAEPWNIVFHRLRDSGSPAIRRACEAAELEALNLELGPETREQSSTEIRTRLAPFAATNGRLPRNSVLIGGPPCQAYSIVGRSRNRGKHNYVPEADHRHFLYREYLRVIAEFQPAVFVMENVKGILTSRIQDAQIFHTILQDLRRPAATTGCTAPAVEYVLQAISETGNLLDDPTPDDFIVRAEEHGVPQARHRVVILGIRRDVFDRAGTIGKLERTGPPTVREVIADLPALRPALSYRGEGMTWLEAVRSPLLATALRELRKSDRPDDREIADRMLAIVDSLESRKDPGFGADRTRLRGSPAAGPPARLAEWYLDRPMDLLTNHESRSHMPTDLVRYLFVATYGQVTKGSPRLADFPRCLLPDHKNVDLEDVGRSIFKDRFRVQVAGQHSMTITSHIAKDGHAFIHPDPVQCRSLTVREAARLQTFPDSYVFLGNRTSQYTQVGNAVPPLLAYQIAEVVGRILGDARMI